MHIVNPPEMIQQLTRSYTGDRFPTGRPQVSDDLLERMKNVSTEEAWGTLRRHGYNNQFVGDWVQVHPGKVLVGRAVTTVFIPHRPDFHELVEEKGKEEGRIGGQNSWVIDTLELGDVLVVDMFGKVKNGTFIGDNLGTSIARRTRAGAVFNCGIRDHRGVSELENMVVFCKGLDPTAIADVTLGGINIPIRIGEVTVLPGDIVLGTPTGVVFIPAHLAQEVVERSEDISTRDRFGHLRLRQGRYTPGEVDRTWSTEIEADFQDWLKTGKPMD
ncbi:ribonuclease activity regulator RraA [soil metagenome]